MRSLFAKIFLSMLLVPVLARGGGLLVSNALGDPRPETVRAVEAVLPLYAQVLGNALDQGGPGAAEVMLAATGKRMGQGLSLRIVPSAPADCAGLGTKPPDRSMQGPGRLLAVAVPDASASPPLCLVAKVAPRARILGVLPASWWALCPCWNWQPAAWSASSWPATLPSPSA